MVAVDLSPAVAITEVMYDPAGNDEGREWVEVTNLSSIALSLPWAADGSDWRFFDGASHLLSWAAGQDRLRPGESMILTRDPDTFIAEHPDYLGILAKVAFELSNTTATLKLSLDGGATWLSVLTYTAADGGSGNGRTLEFEAGNVFQSYQIGGTPGQQRPPKPEEPPLAFQDGAEITEIAWNPAGSDVGQEWIEVQNTGTKTFRFNEINKWKLRIGEINHELRYVSGSTVIFPGERFLIVSDHQILKSRFGERSKLILEASFSLPNRPTFIRLSQTDGLSWLLVDRYDPVSGGADDGRTLERDAAGRWRASVIRGGSPGEENHFWPVSPPRLAIKAFLPYPSPGEEEWIELINLDSIPIDIAGWQLDDGPGGSRPFIFLDDHLNSTVLLPGARRRVFRSQSHIVLNDDRDLVTLRNRLGETIETIPYAEPNEGSVWQRDEFGIGRWSQSSTSPPKKPGQAIVQLTDLGAVIIDQARATPLKIGDLADKPGWYVRVSGQVIESHAKSLLISDQTGMAKVLFHLAQATKPSLHRGDKILIFGIVTSAADQLVIEVTDPTSVILVERAPPRPKRYSTRGPPRTFTSIISPPQASVRLVKLPLTPQSWRRTTRKASTIWLQVAMLGGLLGLTYVSCSARPTIRFGR